MIGQAFFFFFQPIYPLYLQAGKIPDLGCLGFFSPLVGQQFGILFSSLEETGRNDCAGEADWKNLL